MRDKIKPVPSLLLSPQAQTPCSETPVQDQWPLTHCPHPANGAAPSRHTRAPPHIQKAHSRHLDTSTQQDHFKRLMRSSTYINPCNIWLILRYIHNTCLAPLCVLWTRLNHFYLVVLLRFFKLTLPVFDINCSSVLLIEMRIYIPPNST